MARRIVGTDGRPLNYTCTNARFETDIRRGHPHGEGQALGSVLPEPIIRDEEYSLWLEHVSVRNSPADICYWLMWYRNGVPTISMSAILHREDIAAMVQRLLLIQWTETPSIASVA